MFKINEGDTFSEWTFLECGEFATKTKVLARCSCGNEYKVCAANVIRGLSKRCKKCKACASGMSNTRQYKVWSHMVDRCTKENSAYYKDYGGRGITFDEKWSTFKGFWEDMEEGYSDNLELDRKDPNGNYCKDNCKWSTESHQAFNQRKRKTNTSTRTGVYFHKLSGKWWAEIQNNGKTEYLGRFTTFDEACKARESKEIEYYGFTKE